jgi:predicted transcriptional regulator
MEVFHQPVRTFMSKAPITIAPTTSLDEILQILQARGLSALPVVNPANVPIGIVARTDLIRLGLQNAVPRGTSPSLPLPVGTAADVMTKDPVIARADLSIRDAAQLMIRRGIHRVLVAEDQRLVGVLSTLDLATAVFEARITSPVSAWMTAPVVTVDAKQPIAAATDLLDRLHVTAVVVIEDGWPIGVFGQSEALAARDLPRDTPVDVVLDHAMICMPETCRIYRAAAQAAQLEVRRVIATRNHEIVGVVGGLDFARIVATT